MIKIQQIDNNFLYTSNNYRYSCKKLKTRNISAIIVVDNDIINDFNNIYYLNLTEQNLWNKTKLLESIIKVNDIIDKEIKNGSVIIQCKDGKSKSIIFAITYIIHKFNGEPCSVFNYISKKKPDIVSTYLPMLIDIYTNYQLQQQQYKQYQEYQLKQQQYQLQQYQLQQEQYQQYQEYQLKLQKKYEEMYYLNTLI